MEMSNIARRVYHRLSELKTPQSVALLAGYFFLSRSSVYNALIDLEEKNLVEHIGHGQGWRIVR
jgi:predicted transcriptional regulator